MYAPGRMTTPKMQFAEYDVNSVPWGCTVEKPFHCSYTNLKIKVGRREREKSQARLFVRVSMVVCKLDPALKGVCSGSFTFYLKDPSSSLTLHVSETFGLEK